MGNEAIGRGIVECGCSVATSYPGTPASEILESVVTFCKETGSRMHIEWSVNEKVAYEVALAASYTGKRAAVAMKQVGLNVASDPFMRSAYLGVKGGFLLVSADDPGPHSSQTEQDSRFFAMFAKIPVLDPSSPREAKEMVRLAFELSEEYEIPVMLRPTTRVCHARQAVPLLEPERVARTARFEKDPKRWCATPRFVTELHRGLTAKLVRISADPRLVPAFFPGDDTVPRTAIVASGVAFAHTLDVLDEMELSGRVDCYQVKVPYPLPTEFIERIDSGYDRIVVIEETYPVIEMQLADRRIVGRGSKLVPNEGELTPEVIRGVLARFLGLAPAPAAGGSPEPGARPTLCAGCGHRAAYYAISQTFPRGIFPGDIGCYTLGINLGAVDTVHCMGAGISQAAGFYHAYAQDGADFPTVVATIGDSTFFHSGIPALVNAVSQNARIIVVILDNATTAMTGHQPTPQLGTTASGEPGRPVFIRDLVRASGVSFLREVDAYDVQAMTGILREADRYCRGGDGGVAVIIASSPCVLAAESGAPQTVQAVRISEECTGCRECLDMFECPAIVWDEGASRAGISQGACNRCGVCVSACPTQAIVMGQGESA
ncbi:MAG: thiamine pyrophosphate-dependent enzyme [candidate division NC10 bacterium]|nr:thiamine pyrophosphate-dependent enzyme [candidate division NC10 bacterium]